MGKGTTVVLNTTTQTLSFGSFESGTGRRDRTSDGRTSLIYKTRRSTRYRYRVEEVPLLRIVTSRDGPWPTYWTRLDLSLIIVHGRPRVFFDTGRHGRSSHYFNYVSKDKRIKGIDRDFTNIWTYSLFPPINNPEILEV